MVEHRWPPEPSQLARAAAVVRHHLAAGRGVRVGESAVCSRQVHTLDPRAPAEVSVMVGADAGKAFYHRLHPGEVLHLDVFHEVAQVDHRAVARAIQQSVMEMRSYLLAAGWSTSALPPRDLAEYVDVQTSTGGGRVTGSLVFGNRRTLKQAHANHVHLCALLPDEWLYAVFFFTHAVEQTIINLGYEIRKVERVRLERGRGDGTDDLAPYRAATDSRISQSPPPPDSGPGTMSDGHPGGGDEAAGQPERGVVPSEDSYWRGRLHISAIPWRGREGDVRPSWNRWVKARCFTAIPGPEARGRRAPARPRLPGEALTEPAVAETVATAARAIPTRGWELAIRPEDLRLTQRRKIPRIDICLLVDASASMAGKRIRAAKELARQLCRRTRDRIAVLTFSDRSAEVRVPLTGQLGRVMEGIQAIHPAGLTPLAEGLVTAVEYLAAQRARYPLILVVTDGIPTVPKWTLNPLEDALRAAEVVRNHRIELACVGLEPNQEFLRCLVARAGGTLYVFDELEGDQLLRVARQERWKRHQRLISR